MKKRLFILITLCVMCMLLFAVLPAGAAAVTRGMTPVAVITGTNSVSIVGYEQLDSLLPAAKQPTVTLSVKDGDTFEEGSLKTPVAAASRTAVSLLSSTDNAILFVYEGCDGTDYPESTEIPTEAGSYTVRITTKKMYQYYQETGKANYTYTYKNGRMKINSYVFTYPVKFTLRHGEVAWYSDGEKLCTKCSICGHPYEATLSMDMQSGAGLCQYSELGFPVEDNGWTEMTGQQYVLLYEGTEESEYALSDTPPTAYGQYRVSLAPKALWENTPDKVDDCRTRPVTFTVGDDLHKWEYHAEERSLVAECIYCRNVTARVTLDAAAVYETARQLDPSGMKRELFYEDTDALWSTHKTIAPYRVLYDGKEINGSKTTQYISTTHQPENAGNYTARLVILENENDMSPESVKVSTKELPFYVAGKMLKECKVTEYGPTEIAQFTKPRQSGNTYFVGNLSELLWCVYHQADIMDIVLTNDIVVNPITVSDNGNLTSGAQLIYKWKCFGSDKTFVGSIDGQGYTVYGLYLPDGTAEGGLISQGKNVNIKNLTVENSYIKASKTAAAFIASMTVEELGDVGIKNCYSLHNVLISDTKAGGLIGRLEAKEGAANKVTFSGDQNRSTVTAPVAGGILAEGDAGLNMGVTVTLDHCCNYGSVTGSQCAGGIVGKLDLSRESEFNIQYCLNKGYIRSDKVESGILGSVSEKKYEDFTNAGGGLYLNHSVNIGKLDTKCETAADILGYYDSDEGYNVGYMDLSDNYYSQTQNAYMPGMEGAPAATGLTAKEISAGKPCEILGGCVEDYHYSKVVVASCLTDGSKTVCCATCGKTLRTVVTGHHGHLVRNGSCIYCKQSGLAGSLFSSSAVVIGLSFALILSLSAVGFLTVKVNRLKKNRT